MLANGRIRSNMGGLKTSYAKTDKTSNPSYLIQTKNRSNDR